MFCTGKGPQYNTDWKKEEKVMAKAEIVNRVECVEVSVERVNLVLTLDEARTLRRVLGAVGGDVAGSRGWIDNVFEALRPLNLGTDKPSSLIDGNIYFSDDDGQFPNHYTARGGW